MIRANVLGALVAVFALSLGGNAVAARPGWVAKQQKRVAGTGAVQTSADASVDSATNANGTKRELIRHPLGPSARTTTASGESVERIPNKTGATQVWTEFTAGKTKSGKTKVPGMLRNTEAAGKLRSGDKVRYFETTGSPDVKVEVARGSEVVFNRWLTKTPLTRSKVTGDKAFSISSKQ
jgi:hypothetical protein